MDTQSLDKTVITTILSSVDVTVDKATVKVELGPGEWMFETADRIVLRGLSADWRAHYNQRPGGEFIITLDRIGKRMDETEGYDESRDEIPAGESSESGEKPEVEAS